MRIFVRRATALERIPLLKERFPEAEEVLSFMDRVLRFQHRVAEELTGADPEVDLASAETRVERGKPALKLLDLNLGPYLRYLREVLGEMREYGTESIREGADFLLSLSGEEVLSRARRFLKDRTTDDVSRMVFMVWLQPVLSSIAERISFARDRWLRNTCPVCGFKPSVSFLMDSEEGEGVRFLRCSLCLTDWVYVRTMCVNCGNVEDSSMDYYAESGTKYIQLQVCEKCGHYIKIVDLRKEGLAVPDLEDVATLILDLWADRRGYTKVERNILGY
jgi:FdhE protein